MATNLGQAFLGGGGIVPTLAQELAAGNFESRESFHDYIYSKLILGDQSADKSGSATIATTSGTININNQAGTVSGVNTPVFPNTNLSASYPNPLPPPASVSGSFSAHQTVGIPTHMVNAGGSGIIVNNIVNNGNTGSNTNNVVVQNLAPARGGFVTPSNHDANNALNSAASASNVATPAPAQTTKAKKKSQLAQQSNQNHQMVAAQGQIEGEIIKAKKKSHHKKKEKTNICDVCGRGFAEKYTLNRHMLTHTHIKPYACTKCNMAFSRSDGLAKHMAAGHRRIDAHHCDVCGGTFNSEVSFEQHRREYGNTLPFVCNLCMLAFSQCCHLNYHMKSHSLSKINEGFGADGVDHKNEVIDVSELIPEDFSPPKKDDKRNGDLGLSFLDPNIIIKPEIVEGMANASLAAGFDALSNIHASNLSGSNGDTTTPSTASGSVPPISDLDMRKYFDIKIPDPKYFTQGGAGATTTTTDGTNPEGAPIANLFRCEICGKGFTRKYHMQRHERMHRRGPIPRAHLLDWTRRPYACGVCKMGFTRQHHLTRHMLIHTGERPHSCHICGKAFRRFTNLTLHVRTVHGAERPFKCHICGRGFPRLYSLQRHLRLHALKAAGLHPSTAGLTGAALASAACAPTSSPGSSSHKKQNIVVTNTTNTNATAGALLTKAKKSKKKKKKALLAAAAADASAMTVPGATGSIMGTPVTSATDLSSAVAGTLKSQTKSKNLEASSVDGSRNTTGPSKKNLNKQKKAELQRQQQQQQQQQQHQQQQQQQQHQQQQQQQNLIQQQTQLQHPPRPGSQFDNGQQARNDFTNQQQSQPQSSQQIQQITNNGDLRFIPSQGIITGRGIMEGFALAQRGGAEAGTFVLQQQQQPQQPQRATLQSPHQHQLINVLERPGSRSMVTQLTGVENSGVTVGNFHGGFFVPQQLASIDLSAGGRGAAQASMVPLQVQHGQVVTFSHAGAPTHQLVAAGATDQTQQQPPPAYSLNSLAPLNHSVVNSLQFQTVSGAHAALYQQQLGESLSRITDIHQLQQNSAGNSMTPTSHSNNLQY